MAVLRTWPPHIGDNLKTVGRARVTPFAPRSWPPKAGRIKSNPAAPAVKREVEEDWSS